MYARISGRPTEGLEKDLEETTFGGTMKEGIVNAVIDTIYEGEAHVDVTFKNTESSETLSRRIFFMNYDGTDLSYKFKQLISSVATSTEELFEFHDTPVNVCRAEGRRVKLVLEGNGGVKVKRVPEGYKAGDAKAQTITELREEVRKQGLLLYRTEIKEIHDADPTQESTNNTKGGSDTSDTNNGGSRKIPANLSF